MIPPGSNLLLKNVNWQMFEDLLTELGDKRAARLSYSMGMLEIMVPSLEHEDDKVIIGDLVKVILEELDLEFRALGSTTFKNQRMAQAIEADECFYIEHEAMIRGKKRIDLATDPPPDLAIEIDLTSRTHFDNYEKLGVPELWRFDGHKLQIYLLQPSRYMDSATSRHFPQVSVKEEIPRYLARSKDIGRTRTMREFRAWVKAQLDDSTNVEKKK